jgi:hypothetical protein
MALRQYVSWYVVVKISMQSCFILGSSVDKIRHFLYPFQSFLIMSVLDF